MATLRPAREGDVSFVMGVERRPGNDGILARWDAAGHHAALLHPGTAVLIGEDPPGEAVGFAIVEGLDDPHGNVLLRKIAVATPDAGFGQPLLRAVVAWAFARPATHRLWLTVIAHNARARHVYAKHGFQLEGMMREARLTPEGVRRDACQMSILRGEWERAPGGA